MTQWVSSPAAAGRERDPLRPEQELQISLIPADQLLRFRKLAIEPLELASQALAPEHEGGNGPKGASLLHRHNAKPVASKGLGR